MKRSNALAELFCISYSLNNCQEDFDVFEVDYKLAFIKIPDEGAIDILFKQFDLTDQCTIYINIDDAEDDLVYSSTTSFAAFKSDLEVKMRGIEDNTPITLKIKVNKCLDNGELNLYSPSHFSAYLSDFNVADLIDFFSEKIKLNGSLILRSNDFTKTVHSGSIAFRNISEDGNQINFLNETVRTSRLNSYRSLTHAVSLSAKELIPEDFQFNSSPEHGLSTIFERINFALTIIAIFDVTVLTENNLTFKLVGYKAIDGNIDIKTIPVSNYLKEYQAIYDWIYGAGNSTDKMGLARNIISLHLNSPTDLSFSGDMVSSILSAYKVYEKQNIKQYVEIRNKLSDQLIDYNKRANTIVENFAGSFQKSALSVLTLFASIAAMKVLGTTIAPKNFVIYSSIFSLVILIISLVYMFISRADTIEQKKRYERSYKNFKERYTDLLNIQDISRILNDDKEFDEDIKFIKKKIKNYTFLWTIVLIAIGAFVGIYFINEKLEEINTVMVNYPNI
jgi:hypothetical protein